MSLMMKRGKLELLVVTVAREEGEIVGGTTNDELIDYLCSVLRFLHPLLFYVLLSFFFFSLPALSVLLSSVIYRVCKCCKIWGVTI